MILRFAPIALLALLVSGTGALAGQGDAPRVPGVPRVPSVRPVPPVRAHVSAETEDDEQESTDTTVSVPARSRFVLENFKGQVVVTGWDRNSVRVRAEHQPRTRIQVDVRPATVTLRSTRRIRLPDFGDSRRARVQDVDIPSEVDYRLTVPRWMSLGLSGVDSDISVEGMEADVTAEVVNGEVLVRGGRGSIRVGSINGGVEVIGASGSVEASSVNDGATLRNVTGRVRVESVNGDVKLDGIVSDAVDASTVSGDLRYEGALRAGGSYRFESHSGDLTVVLPERPDVTVSVDTYSGEFASSFPAQSKSTFSSVRGRGKEFEFTLGEGRAELSLQSFSGLIRLARAGEPAGRARTVITRKDK
jgi:DUF4097 and DUF4098 domain-containing protein YvlB